MTRDEFAGAFIAMMQRLVTRPAAVVNQDARLADDLDLDSLSRTEMAAATEEQFGVRIPDSVLESFKTVGDIVEYVFPRLG